MAMLISCLTDETECKMFICMLVQVYDLFRTMETYDTHPSVWSR